MFEHVETGIFFFLVFSFHIYEKKLVFLLPETMLKPEHLEREWKLLKDLKPEIRWSGGSRREKTRAFTSETDRRPTSWPAKKRKKKIRKSESRTVRRCRSRERSESFAVMRPEKRRQPRRWRRPSSIWRPRRCRKKIICKKLWGDIGQVLFLMNYKNISQFAAATFFFFFS